MNRNEEWEALKQDYSEIRIPEQGLEKMQDAIRRAKMEKRRAEKKKLVRNFGIGAAAVLALAILPNTNQEIAYAMGNLPVIGGLFRVITVREYNYDDGHNTANVEIPRITVEDTEGGAGSGATAAVNKSVEEYTDELIGQFHADMAEEGYKELDVSYETVTDTADWFVLKVTGLEVQASGFQFYRYYNIDKKKDAVVQLKDLFGEGVDYVAPLSEEIKRQMREQMERGEATYFLDEEEWGTVFEAIKEDQNFYLDAEGNLLIAFDEYEVGPGAIGSPVFSIPAEVVSGIK